MTKISPTPIMKYIVHYIGEWRPDYLGNGDPIFNPPWKKEYDHIDDIEIFFRKEFEQMLLEGISVSYVDSYMWHIKNVDANTMR